MKFSIIMPVYNTALYLKKSIQSVIEQTYENWELICVNDGSTDDSLEICEHYAKQDSRIKVFSKVNEGVSVARNFGLKKVTGERVIFLDADDWLSSNYIEQQAKEKLGMKKLTNKQTVYVTLPKKDYVESPSEKVITKEEKNWFESLVDKIFNK